MAVVTTERVGLRGRGATRGPWRDAFRRFIRNPIGLLGAGIVLFYIVVAIFGPALNPADPLKQDWQRIAEPPSREHLLGTDELGRDMLSRIIGGARTALGVAFAVTLMTAALGTLIGLVSGYLRGWTDAALMRLTDFLMGFPSFVFAAFLTATLRPPAVRMGQRLAESTGLTWLGNRVLIDYILVFGALTLVSWYGYARLVRGQVLSLREREFVEAARAMGATTWWVMVHHILPNSVTPVIVAASVSLGSAVLAESALSFLGIGVQPPAPSWGQMIQANLDQWRYKPHLVVIPGVVLAVLTLGFNFVGDAVADALNPRQQRI